MKNLMRLAAVPLLVACGGGPDTQGGPPNAPPVLNVTWEWVSTLTPTERIQVAHPERYTLILQDDGNARVRFDCNQGRGTYHLSAGTLSFGPLLSTRMACPEDTQDAQYMDGLQRVASYFVQDGDLFLELPMDSGTMRFRRAR